MRTLFVHTPNELPFAEKVAAELARCFDTPCEASLTERAPAPGEIHLAQRGTTSVKKLKTAIEIKMRFEAFGAAKPMPVKVALTVEGDDDPSSELTQRCLANSVARDILPIFEEQVAPARKDVVVYSLWCGAPLAEELARGLSAAGYDCSIRTENPQTYPDDQRPWGRVAPGGLLVTDEVRARIVTVGLGERIVELRNVKAKEIAGLAAKLVVKVQKLVDQQRAS